MNEKCYRIIVCSAVNDDVAFFAKGKDTAISPALCSGFVKKYKKLIYQINMIGVNYEMGYSCCSHRIDGHGCT